MTRQKLLGLAAITLMIAVAGAYAVMSHPGRLVAQPVAESPEPAAPEETAAAPEPAPAAVDAGSVDAGSVDLERALAPRELGSKDAPVVIEEFASLSCGHCAHFHKEVLPKLIETYVDTGKVRFIFTDFPLNGPAMDAAMLSRCLPEDRYFKFVKFLFADQEEWAYTNDYDRVLSQNAKLSGASQQLVESCLGNEKLKQGLADRMKEASEKHDVKATPTFVINGTETLRGAHDFDNFAKVIDKKLAESN